MQSTVKCYKDIFFPKHSFQQLIATREIKMHRIEGNKKKILEHSLVFQNSHVHLKKLYKLFSSENSRINQEEYCHVEKFLIN